MTIKKFHDDSFFNRLTRLEDVFKNFFGEDNEFPKGFGPAVPANWSPRIDIKENAKNYEIIAEFPGVNKEDIDVSIENNVLTIKGEKKVENKKEEEDYIHIERSYGSFYRSFRLPEQIDPDKVEASFKSGVLTLMLKKKEEKKGKKIEIKT